MSRSGCSLSLVQRVQIRLASTYGIHPAKLQGRQAHLETVGRYLLGLPPDQTSL